MMMSKQVRAGAKSVEASRKQATFDGGLSTAWLETKTHPEGVRLVKIPSESTFAEKRPETQRRLWKRERDLKSHLRGQEAH